MEDILCLVDGRQELIAEIAEADENVRTYIDEKVTALLNHRDIDSDVQSAAAGDAGRESLIFERLDAIKAMAENDQ
jgi:hypothetical protein